MWISNKEEITSIKQLPENSYGFIYQIHYTDGTFYYGMKRLYKNTTLPALKNGKQRPNSIRKGKNKNGKRVHYDIITKESDWLTYVGSSEETKSLEIKYKEILAVAVSKRELSYLEAKCLFQTEALEDDKCRNSNILGKFFRDNLQ